MSNTKPKASSADSEGKSLLNLGYLLSYAVIIFGGIFAYLFASKFESAFDKSSTWGELGDFLGGTTNPIIGLATVALVLISIRIQRLELRSSLAQLELSNTYAARQSFEQSLFAWLGNYHELLGSIQTDRSTSGRSALVEWFEKGFSTIAVERRCSEPDIYGQTTPESIVDMRSRLEALRKSVLDGKLPADEIHAIYRKAMSGFLKAFSAHRSDLDALFRTLYRLLLWIDKTHTDLEQRRHYVSLVRAQLSWIEMIYLLFNGLTLEGRKFAYLCNKYALFDNLDTSEEFILKIICDDLRERPPSEWDPKLGSPPWPYAKSAFSSDIARGMDYEDDAFDSPMFSRRGTAT